MRLYQRKRKRQYFEHIPQAKRSKPTNLSILTTSLGTMRNSFTIYSSYLLCPLHLTGKERGITGGNAGQVAREFASKSGVDTEIGWQIKGNTEASCQTKKAVGRGDLLQLQMMSKPSRKSLQEVKLLWADFACHITWSNLQQGMGSLTDQKSLQLVVSSPS